MFVGGLFIFLFLYGFLLLYRTRKKNGCRRDSVLTDVGPNSGTTLLVIRFNAARSSAHTLAVSTVGTGTRTTFPRLGFRRTCASHVVVHHLGRHNVAGLAPLSTVLGLHDRNCARLVMRDAGVVSKMRVRSLHQSIRGTLPFFGRVHMNAPLLCSVRSTRGITDVLKGHCGTPTRDGGTAGRRFILINRNACAPDATVCDRVSCVLGTNKLAGFRINAVRNCPAFSAVLTRLGTKGTGHIALVPFVFITKSRTGGSVTKR